MTYLEQGSGTLTKSAKSTLKRLESPDTENVPPREILRLIKEDFPTGVTFFEDQRKLWGKKKKRKQPKKNTRMKVRQSEKEIILPIDHDNTLTWEVYRLLSNPLRRDTVERIFRMSISIEGGTITVRNLRRKPKRKDIPSKERR